MTIDRESFGRAVSDIAYLALGICLFWLCKHLAGRILTERGM